MIRLALIFDLTEPQLPVLKSLSESPDSELLVYCPGPAAPPVSWRCRRLDSEWATMSHAAEADELLLFSVPQPRLDERLLSNLLGARPKRITWIDGTGTKQAASGTSGPPNLLFVFPGSIVPLTLGSHQRAFNLLRNLRESGHVIDVLIPEPKNREAVESALRSTVANVYFYRPTKRKYRRWRRLLRWLDQAWRRLRGQSTQLPDLYTERAYTKPVESAARWLNSLYLAKRYPLIIVSYAWMLDVVRHIQPMRRDFKLICDTHDVQFHRNASLLHRWDRLFFSPAQQRRRELRDLGRTDAVITISPSDQKLLKAHLKKTRVTRISPGFDYAEVRPKRRPIDRPLSFGFIGGSMDANALALRYIVSEWWPAIRRYSPDSQLFVAGSVSRRPDVVQSTFFDGSIVLLGFVDSLQHYYRKIDVVLNPVCVAGGLNFKSVEAVFAGKHLLTNELGAECLGDGFPCTLVRAADDLLAFIKAIEFDAEEDLRRRQQALQTAKEIFSNRKACTDLISHLGFSD